MIKNPRKWECFIQDYTLRFTVNEGTGYIKILNGEGKTSDMPMTITKVNDIILTLKDVKEKMVSDEFDKQKYKDKYDVYERMIMRKEVIEDSRGETKV